MRKIILNVYDGATGKKLGYYDHVAITNKSYDNKRISWDIDEQAWTLNVLNWRDPNDIIEFYIAKDGSMKVNRNYKLITYKVKDIPTDRYGNHNIIMERVTSIKVVDNNNQPIKDALVLIFSQNNNPYVYNTNLTDDEGSISVNVDRDDIVIVAKNGYDLFITQNLVSKAENLVKLTPNPNIEVIKKIKIKTETIPFSDMLQHIHLGMNGNQETPKLYFNNTLIQPNLPDGTYLLLGKKTDKIRIIYKGVEKNYTLQDLPVEVNFSIIETAISNGNTNQTQATGNSNNTPTPANTHTQPVGGQLHTPPQNLIGSARDDKYNFHYNNQTNHTNNTTAYTPPPTQQAGFPLWLKIVFGGMAARTVYKMFFKKTKTTK